MNKKLVDYVAIIEKLKPELISRFQISQLSIFGSFVRGEETSDSDLDVLVSFSEMPSLFKFIDLQNFLADALEIKIDLVILEDLKPIISQYILGEKIDVV